MIALLARGVECGHGLLVNLAADLETLTALELKQRRPCLLTEDAIGLANIEPVLVQLHLHLPDFLPAQMHRARGAALAHGCRRLRAHRQRRYYPAAVVHDDHVILDDEIHVPAPFRMDYNECLGDLHDLYMGRNDCADGKGEIKPIAVNAGNVRPGEHCLPDPGALLVGQRHATRGLGLLLGAHALRPTGRRVRGLLRLSLTLLLRLRLPGLTLLLGLRLLSLTLLLGLRPLSLTLLRL